MDTASHLLFGATLGGLAMLDPALAAQPAAMLAVWTATLLGSHAADFDTVMRLKGQAAYVRHHRGITHSLPAPAIWSLLGLPIAWLYGVPELAWQVVGWMFVAVCFHVLLDLFNSFGVQCARPVSQKWLHLDTLCLFDPYLFVLHASGCILWASDIAVPGPMFAIIYTITVFYIGWRLLISRKVKRLLRESFGISTGITLVPSLLGYSWQFTADCGDHYAAGTVAGGLVTIETTVSKSDSTELAPVVRAAMNEEGVKALLSFSERVHVNVQEKQGGYEVTWSDVRFWNKQQMPFGVAVTLDADMKVLNHRLGWNKKTWEPPHV